MTSALMGTRIGNMKKNLLLVLLSLLISIFLLEGVVRILNLEEPKVMQKGPKEDWALVPERIWTEHHPQLGWYHQKNKDSVHDLENFSVKIHTNSAGFRGYREYTREKPAGTVRVLAVGDSFTFGFGVADDQPFPVVLEKRHDRLEVLNLGVAAYGIDQMLMAFRHIGLEYQADYVFISIFPEDFWRNLRAFADTGHAKPYFILKPDETLKLQNVPVPQPFTLRTNQFPEVIQYGPIENILMKSAAYRLCQRTFLKIAKGLDWIDPDTTAEWILGRVILKQLIDEIEESGARPVLIAIPPDRWIRDYRKTSLQRSLIRFAEKEGVDFIDLTPIFREAIPAGRLSDYYIEGDGHWTAKGHELAANAFEEYLENQGVKLKSIP